MGTLWQPGCLRTRSSWRTVLSTVVLAHRSTLLTTMKKGTFRARASPRCSLVVPAASEKEGRQQERRVRMWEGAEGTREFVGLPGSRRLRVGESAPPSSPVPAPLARTDPSVSADEQQGAVGAVRGEAEDGGVEVLVVAGQVDEGDHLGAAFADLFCRP